MKKLVLGLMLVSVMMLSGCAQNVEPGNVGLVISKLGGNRGVSAEDMVSGWVFYLPFKSKVVEYPIFNQRVAWTHDIAEGKPTNEELTFQTKDNVPVALDVAVNYSLKSDKVPAFYTQFRADNIEYFTHGYMRDQARNAVAQIGSEYSFDEVNGPKKEEFFNKVNTFLSEAVRPYGVEIKQNGLSAIGALRPPETLKAAIAARAKAIQDSITAENELRTFKANAAKAVAQAEGEAAANRALVASINPTLIEWEKLKIEKARIARWNGAYPSTMLSGANTLLNVK